MWSLSPCVLTLTTSPQGRPCNAITAAKSFRVAASSAAGAGIARNDASEIASARTITHLLMPSPGVRSNRCDISELHRIGKNAPNCFARGRNRRSQRRVAVLQEREHLEDEQIIWAA